MCIVYEIFGDLATAAAYTVVIIGAGFLQHHVQRLRSSFCVLVSLRLRLAVALIGSGLQYRKLAVLFNAIFVFGGMAFLQIFGDMAMVLSLFSLSCLASSVSTAFTGISL